MENFEIRQQQIYSFIKEYIDKNHIPPTIREIGINTGISSTSVIHNHLSKLEEKGLIRRSPLKKRHIEITQSHESVKNVPLVGTVHAGEPVYAFENIESYFPLPESLARDEDTFMLKIQGDSMIDAGIFQGDLVIVKKQNYGENNDIVIALVEGEATCKRLIKNGKETYLKPENKLYKPIFSDSVYIIGKVTGLYRSIS